MELRVMNRVSWGWGEWRLKAWTPFRRQCYLYAKWQMAGVGSRSRKADNRVWQRFHRKDC